MTMMRKMSRGYKRGGGVNKTTTTTTTSTKEKEKPGIIKRIAANAIAAPEIIS